MSRTTARQRVEFCFPSCESGDIRGQADILRRPSALDVRQDIPRPLFTPSPTTHATQNVENEPDYERLTQPEVPLKEPEARAADALNHTFNMRSNLPSVLVSHPHERRSSGQWQKGKLGQNPRKSRFQKVLGIVVPNPSS